MFRFNCSPILPFSHFCYFGAILAFILLRPFLTVAVVISVFSLNGYFFGKSIEQLEGEGLRILEICRQQSACPETPYGWSEGTSIFPPSMIFGERIPVRAGYLVAGDTRRFSICYQENLDKDRCYSGGLNADMSWGNVYH